MEIEGAAQAVFHFVWQTSEKWTLYALSSPFEVNFCRDK